VFTPLFLAAPANACEGGPAAVALCQLACSKGGQSAECPASGAQPAGPPQQAPVAPAALPPPPAGRTSPAATASGTTTSPTTSGSTNRRSSRFGN
jgi:hypothetical protein